MPERPRLHDVRARTFVRVQYATHVEMGDLIITFSTHSRRARIDISMYESREPGKDGQDRRDVGGGRTVVSPSLESFTRTLGNATTASRASS